MGNRRIGDADTFGQARSRFVRELPDEVWQIQGYADLYYPFFFEMSESELELHVEIGEAIAAGVRELVYNYENDQRIQDAIPLTARTRELLSFIEDVPIGDAFLRPDYIYNAVGIPLICEVGARFPFNGFYMSAFGDHALDADRLVPGMTQLESRLRSLEEELDGSTTIVKDAELGFDVHYFRHRARASVVLPEQMPHEGTLVLELREYELEKHLEEVVDRIRFGVATINDPRVTLIGHDKRLLSLLGNADVMHEYIDPEQARLLQKHVIPTYVSGRDAPEQAYREPSAFIAKPAKSGKTKGFTIGSHGDRWKRKLDEQGHAIQPRIVQPVYELWNPRKNEWTEWNLAGTTYIIGDQSFGAGLLRAFDTSVGSMAGIIQPAKQIE